MLNEIREFLTPREERVKLGDQEVIVRELTAATELGELARGEDAIYAVAVHCTFDQSGALVFSEKDIPFLKAASKLKLLSLFGAVQRVNGMDIEDEMGKPDAAPG